MLKKVMIVLAVLVTICCVLPALVGLMLPTKYDVSRATTASVKPEQVYPLIANLKRWPEWGKWWVDDPQLLENTTFTGPESGVGAKMSWTSESQGNGEFEILTADPATGITYVLDMDGYVINGEVGLSPSAGGGTHVNMRCTGDMGKAGPMGGLIVPMMDALLGESFTYNLEGIKALAEKATDK